MSFWPQICPANHLLAQDFKSLCRANLQKTFSQVMERIARPSSSLLMTNRIASCRTMKNNFWLESVSALTFEKALRTSLKRIKFRSLKLIKSELIHKLLKINSWWNKNRWILKSNILSPRPTLTRNWMKVRMIIQTFKIVKVPFSMEHLFMWLLTSFWSRKSKQIATIQLLRSLLWQVTKRHSKPTEALINSLIRLTSVLISNKMTSSSTYYISLRMRRKLMNLKTRPRQLKMTRANCSEIAQIASRILVIFAVNLWSSLVQMSLQARIQMFLN